MISLDAESVDGHKCDAKFRALQGPLGALILAFETVAAKS